ncbi:MAG: radical SAM protein [Bacillota bacterium]
MPLTSHCNAACVFCSHRFNPPGVEIHHLPPRPLDEVVASLDWLAGAEKIIIGESVTRINEGEPLTHPDLVPILEAIGNRLPGRRVRLTTNGSLLDARTASIMARLGVELVISLNSANPRVRSQIMGDTNAAAGLEAVELAARLGITFEGSLVALPELVGYDDVAETVLFLAGRGASCIRVMEPGFTRLTPAALVPRPGTRRRLEQLVAQLRANTGIPVILEPPHPRDLRAVVEGVVSGSPAQSAGIQAGDLVETIDGSKPFSRVDAFARLVKSRDPKVTVKGKSGQFTLAKSPGQPAGMVLCWDLAVGDVAGIAESVVGARQPLVITSRLGGRILRLGLARAGIAAGVRPVPSSFFGGSIACAGLLTTGDVVAHFREHPPPPGTDLLLLPPRAFDPWNRDLTGRSYREIERETGILCVIPRPNQEQE